MQSTFCIIWQSFAYKYSVSPRFMALGGEGGGGVPFFFQHKNIHLIYLLINEN